MNRLKFIIAFVSVIATMAVPHRVNAQIPEGWEIVEVTSDAQVFDNRPDINDRGQIVFNRQLAANLSSNEIFLYDRGQLIQITNDEVGDVFARISNLGEIVWSRDLHGDGNLSIVVWREGKIQVISDQPYNEGDPDINDSGQIVWQGNPEQPSNEVDLFLFNTSMTIRITDDAFANRTPRINEIGVFVWSRNDFSGSDRPWEVMLYDKGTIRQLSAGQGQIQFPDLNNQLDVVWASPQAGVELWRNGKTVQVSQDGYGPSINDHGTVAFSRWDLVRQNFSLWMLRNEGLVEITTSSFGGIGAEINQRGEVVFLWGNSPRNIALLTNPRFRADLDLDADADLADFAIMQNCWDASPSLGGGCSGPDLNGDGVVELGDAKMFVELLGGPRQEP